ncbi:MULTISPECIES: restriction endonuclease subunit S [unclassified Bacillus (in: firmicutes)]|uniref:restriction endonuclease subunit S n=1 Tax=unclassified Bacillus (in: firmicutes) TaxID=185979 RepID=UPI0004E1909E|nr:MULTISPECIES: restriction endonuclease subunit S [unclassified Bacillus (in: firmicutes)]
MSIWSMERLEDICLKITDGAHNSPPTVQDSGYLMASVKDMTQFGFNLNTCRNISKEDYENLIRQGCQPEINDVLIAKDGNSCLETVLVQRIFQPIVLLSSVAILRPDTSKVLPDYLALYLSEKDNIRNMKETLVSGSAIPRVILKAFREYRIPLPPIEIQEKIVSIMGAINRKIELALLMNETLEEMGYELYKHYFIKFEPFMDWEFIDSESGLIPSIWKEVEIGKVVKVLGGGTPKTSMGEFWENGTINWFSPTDLTSQKSLFITKSAKKITQLGLEKSSAKLFPPYSIMMTSRATIGEISINREESCTNQGFITLIPNDKFSIYQLYYWLKTSMEQILSISNGSTFKEVSKTNFKKLLILEAVGIEEFTNKCTNIFNQIESNLIEIQQLMETKEYLLPRLLSGDIELSEVEELIK